MEGELYEWFLTQYPDMIDDIAETIELNTYELYIKFEDGRETIYDGDYNTFIDLNEGDLTDTKKSYKLSVLLRKLIRDKHLSQRILANRIDIAQPILHKYIHCVTKPSEYVEQKIAKYMKCSIEELYRK